MQQHKKIFADEVILLISGQEARCYVKEVNISTGITECSNTTVIICTTKVSVNFKFTEKNLNVEFLITFYDLKDIRLPLRNRKAFG